MLVLVLLGQALGETDMKLKNGLLWKVKEMGRQDEDKKEAMVAWVWTLRVHYTIMYI